MSPAASSQGCLSPVRIVVPESSILHPSLDAGVVGGNVLTSQRVVDVIFRAFEVCAASQVRGVQKGQAGGSQMLGLGATHLLRQGIGGLVQMPAGPRSSLVL